MIPGGSLGNGPISWALLSSIAVVTFGFVSTMWFRRVGRRWARRLLTSFGVIICVVGAVALVWSSMAATGDRSPRALELDRDVTYQRIALDEPRRQVLHVAEIDLDNRCVGLSTTIPGADGVVNAETATEFVGRARALLSVNLAFFYPIHEYPYWNAYPRSGDPITAVGWVVVDGVTHGTESEWGRALNVVDGKASVGPYQQGADLSVPGASLLAVDGVVVAPDVPPAPRTVVGVDYETNRLFLVVFDGKQPGYAEGVTLREAGEWLVAYGADDVIELDGGGSASMAATVDGQVELLSRPSHQRIPGRQRPVATHLGVIDTCPTT